MNKPVIGITLDHDSSGNYSQYPRYVLSEAYACAVWQHGGVPVMLPHVFEAVGRYISSIDGLLLTGGDFDIDPLTYGERTSSSYVKTKDARTKFEMEICQQAIEKKIPTLGICAGEQLLNVLLGGSLIQHIPDVIENPLEHEQKNAKHEPSHMVKVTVNSLLHKVLGVTDFMVNSSHHQAVKSVGKNLVINAIAPDGVIEGIELDSSWFCLGVQWHPEFLTTDQDARIFSAFLKACSSKQF